MNDLLQSLFGRVSGTRQIAIVVVGALVTALVFGVSRWATQPVMVPLYSNIPMDNVGKMTDKLTEVGIVYELEGSGSTILVSSIDLPKARVALARDGTPDTGRPGLELFDKPSWGMTDYTQRVNFRRALEGELERTIGKMRDVKAVQVHLALEDDQLFKKNERPSKASVTLTMTSGESPRAETVRGIASLVSSSVGGLDAQHVMIVDERGQALTMDDDGSMTGLSSRQLSVQREVETYYQQKADKLLSSLVGAGNARVQVAASINFDKVERTVQAIDPDKQALATEQKSEVTPSSPSQGASSSQTSTSYENTHSVESFSGAIGNVKRLTVAVLVADKVTMPVVDTTKKKALAAPVITPRNADEITRIETLVRNALGVDSTRGDLISVMSAPFDIPAPLPKADTLPTPDMMTKLQANPKPLVAISALVVLLIVAVVMLSALKPRKSANTAETRGTLPPTPAYPELPASAQLRSALSAGSETDEMGFEDQRRATMLPPPPTTFEREQAMATVDQRPDAAVRVTRGWLNS